MFKWILDLDNKQCSGLSVAGYGNYVRLKKKQKKNIASDARLWTPLNLVEKKHVFI